MDNWHVIRESETVPALAGGNFECSCKKRLVKIPTNPFANTFCDYCGKAWMIIYIDQKHFEYKVQVVR